MNDNSIPNFMIEVKVVDEQNGTYIHENEEDGKIRIHLDSQDRFDLVQRFNETIRHLRTYHTAIKGGCLNCGTEIILSGAATEDQHKIEGFSCTECGGDLINLDGGGSDD